MAFESFPNIIADSHDSSTKCAGKKSFEDCQTAQHLMAATENFRPDRHLWVGNDTLNRLQYFQLGCVACRHVCTIARRMKDGIPTEQAQVICSLPEVLSSA